MSLLLDTITAAAPPAGGAATGEILIASVSASIITAVLLFLGMGHRSGRVKLLGRLAAFSERASGLPGWAALPSVVAAGSLLVAVFGMYWDISLHIDVGRDEGPLANPAHYFILFGLYGIFTAGFLAMVLPKGDAGPAAVRITRTWHAPLGGVLICACGAFSLIGFPLDDVWHRLFGQDVTLWGPTHLMLIGGASMTLLGIGVLMMEGRRALHAVGRAGDELTWMRALRPIALTGGFLLGLSTFQAEFDFGVPQFRFVLQPMLIMMAAGGALVAARIWIGPGAALGAVAFFVAVRGILALLIGPVLGEATPHFPLYLAEAVIVELVVWRVGMRRPVVAGLWCGLLLGTVGLAAEWGWSHVWMPLPWPESMLPEAALMGMICAVGASCVGAWIGTRLAEEPRPRTSGLRAAGALGAVALLAAIAVGLPKPAQEGVVAKVTLTDVRPAPDRLVHATVRLDPPDAADDARWLTSTAWQGGGLIVSPLKRIGPGVYRTTEPLPAYPDWKSLIRLHVGRSLTAIPVFLPEDPAIPAPAVPARPRFERTFVTDHEILQREQKDDVAGALPPLAYGVVLAIALSLLGLLAWGLHRLAATPTRAQAGSSDRGRATSIPPAVVAR